MKETELVEEVIRELKKRLNQGKVEDGQVRTPCSRILVLGELTPEEIKALSCGTVTSDYKDSFDIVVAAELGEDQMAQIALGCPRDREASCILKSLLEGKTVYILERGLNYRKYKETAFNTLYRLYQEYEERICRYGAVILKELGEMREISGSFEAAGKEAYLDLTGVRVLTESHLNKMRGAGAGILKIDKGAVITPLARDYITNHSLQIRRG